MTLTKEKLKKLLPSEKLSKMGFRQVMENMAIGKNFQDTLGLSDSMMQELYDIANSYLEDKQYDEAADCFLFLTVLNPMESRLWIKSGNAAQGLKRYDEALEAYSMAMYTDADDPFPHFYSAQVYTEKGSLHEAKACLAICFQIIDEHPAFLPLKETALQLEHYLQKGDKK